MFCGKCGKKQILLKITVAALIVAAALAIILPVVLKNPNTEAPTPSSASHDQTRINKSLLRDIGLTYGEIEGKYGEPIGAANIEGTVYMFKNEPLALYYFEGGWYDGSSVVLPDKYDRCISIIADVKTFFRDFKSKMSVSDIERELGVSAEIGSSSDDIREVKFIFRCLNEGKSFSDAMEELKSFVKTSDKEYCNICVFKYEDYVVFISLDENNEVNAEEDFIQIVSIELNPEYGSLAETPAHSDKITFNGDLLSDIGYEYGRLTDKYGDGTNISGFEGELFADFNNSTYRFRAGDKNGSAYIGGGFEAVPKDDAVCYAIDTGANSVFNGLSGRCSVSDLKDLGINASVASSRRASFAGEIEGYYCHFEYGNCEIDIELDEKSNEFTKNSPVFILLKEISAKQAYEPIINEYKEACKADGYDKEELQRLYPNVNEGMMFFYHMDGNTSSFYYCLKDINSDGVEELFIGFGDGIISLVDLYLFDGKKAVKAIDNDTLGNRSRLILYTDGTLYENGSGGASSGAAAIYRVNNRGTALETVYAYDYEYTETGGWYYNENETISADDFYKLLNGKTEDTSFSWRVL